MPTKLITLKGYFRAEIELLLPKEREDIINGNEAKVKVNPKELIRHLSKDQVFLHSNELLDVSGNERRTSNVHQLCLRKEISRWIN